MTFLQVEGWSSPPTIVATGFHERWRGLRPSTNGRALLLHGSAVHGVSMQEALWVVGLDQDATVIDIRLLQPGRLVRVSGASWLLEMAATEEPPPFGATLRVAGNGQRVTGSG